MADKIINFDAVKAVEKLNEREKATAENRKNIFEDLFAAMGQEQEETGMEDIAKILALPDEQFDILAPVFLEELERSYSNTDNQLFVAQAMAASGYKAEDLTEDAKKICDEIDNQMKAVVDNKRLDFLKRFLLIIFNAITETEGIAHRILTVPVKIDEDGKLPTYAHVTDAGADIYAAEEMDILPGEHRLVKTGVHIAVPKGYEIQVRCKSGIANKTNLIVKNGIGTVDEGYTGDISVILANIAPPIKNITIDDDGKVKDILYGPVEHIEKGQKIAQIVLCENPKMTFVKVNSLMETDRGEGGFGSTGLK